jgi:hypothetical protein
MCIAHTLLVFPPIKSVLYIAEKANAVRRYWFPRLVLVKWMYVYTVRKSEFRFAYCTLLNIINFSYMYMSVQVYEYLPQIEYLIQSVQLECTSKENKQAYSTVRVVYLCMYCT